jgi:alpha-2-macroglobulin
MKTKGFVCALVMFFVFQSCRKQSAAEFNSDFSLFKEYISSFTSGIVSTRSDIRVVLAFEKKDWQPKQILDNSLFDISPAVDGKVVVLSANTIAFIPEKTLEQNTEYKIKFKLSELIETPKDLSEFRFTVKTIKQDFVITTQDLQSYSKDFQYLNCVMKTADHMAFDDAKKLVSAQQKGRQLKIKFDKTMSTPTEFKFVVDSIQRYVEDTTLEINYDGSDADIDQKGKITYPVIGKDNFKIIDVEVPEGNQSVYINFSDPLKTDQDFNGLVSVESAKNLRYATQGNVLKVFFDEPLHGNQLLEVFQGIESEDGFKMKKSFATRLMFEQIKPGVRFMKSGTILPSSNNLKLNFEAVNLSHVDVKVFKIYKNNILQFLQNNDLNGASSLRRVGQPVTKTKLSLKDSKLANSGKWNAYALDLSKLITPEPGAIYRVEMSFKKAYSLYACAAAAEPEPEREVEETDENDVNYSGGSDYEYDEYYDDYNWEEREDPCANSYYYNTKIATNILATDLGVIAKRGANKSYFIAVNNIVTTEPVGGAKVDLYSYQQQLLGSGTTDGMGTAAFKISSFAYFAIVTQGNNSTYVRLDDGNSLSVSNFNVSGETLQKGLKGFIYGERGVWRPGDNLYLSFFLNDANNKLPKSHPIKFRLTDPKGKITFQKVLKANDWNHYALAVPTSSDAPTGNWEAMFSVGGARFYKNIKVETIKPNRLRIKNKFAKAVLSSAHDNTANLEVTWLHGAIAKNLKVDMQAKFSQQQTMFKGFEKFVFDDAVRKFSTEEINIFTGKIDANGRASVPINPELEGVAPGMLKAAFITKVYEEGGDVSTDVVATTYSPYRSYVGLRAPEPSKYGMLETRKMNRFEIATVDENGKPKPAKNLDVRVYKVEWRWWWDASNDDELSNYNSDEVTTAVKNFIVNTNDSGKGSFQFSLTDDEWGRYLVRVTDPVSGHSTSQTISIDWPYWSGKTRNQDASMATMLMFSTDKEKYAVGEQARISFPSSEGGRALISIENGSKVVKTYWAKTRKGETAVEIPITAAMAPNVYFNITLLQPHATTKNDSPIRMYGIVPVEVVDKTTILEPKLSMPDVLKPEQNFTVKVSENTGKPMTYTIAIVDEGLLDLTRFKTPNAWDSFYAREALGVKTWDVYDNVIGAYGGKVNQIFSIGGDQDLGGGKAKKANRFKPVVVYLGPYKLEKGQSKSHQIKLPKYVGSVRTMVVAGDATTSAYGSVEKATPVRSPLMVLASMPRKISPSERVTIPVTVFAMEKHVRNVNVQLKATGLKIVGAASQNLTFTQPDEKMAYFNLEVGALTGIGKVQVIATSGREKSAYDVEIDMTNPNPVTYAYKDVILEANQAKTISWETFGVAGSNKARLEISSMPTMDLNRRLQYLIEYPHGCIEQTTSSVFPQLYLTDVADIDGKRKAMIQRNISAGINRLARFQQSNGGFSYWPGDTDVDDWGTSYAGHFLLEAEKKGYVLPINFRNKWIGYQQKEAKEWRFVSEYGNDFAQAYRLYTLALAGSPDLASMNRLRETTGISNESKLRLAVAYAIAGQKQAAMGLLAKSKIDDADSNYRWYYYGSADRNRAMALETLVLLGQKQKAFAMAMKVAKDMASSEWMSTQSTAYCLYAMSKFAAINGAGGLSVQYSKDGKSETITTTKSVADRSLVIKSGTNGVTVRNTKGNTIYIRLFYSGILPIGKEQTAQNDVLAKVAYKDRKGAPVNVAKITQGTEFVAEITITNQRSEYVENIALTQILPSGFEIVNTRFTDYGDAADNTADYIDIRDDRTNFYFGLKDGETKTFRVLLNASYLGTYYLPGLQCEAMYDHTFLARNKGQWIQVVK